MRGGLLADFMVVVAIDAFHCVGCCGCSELVCVGVLVSFAVVGWLIP